MPNYIIEVEPLWEGKTRYWRFTLKRKIDFGNDTTTYEVARSVAKYEMRIQAIQFPLIPSQYLDFKNHF